MMVTEIKQLFAEELTLLKNIQRYGKRHSQAELERVERECKVNCVMLQ